MGFVVDISVDTAEMRRQPQEDGEFDRWPSSLEKSL